MYNTRGRTIKRSWHLEMQTVLKTITPSSLVANNINTIKIINHKTQYWIVTELLPKIKNKKNQKPENLITLILKN